jgi:hypothetical protein
MPPPMSTASQAAQSERVPQALVVGGDVGTRIGKARHSPGAQRTLRLLSRRAVFLACGRHLAAGCVDMAPLTAFYARIALLLGGWLHALRLIPALAGAALGRADRLRRAPTGRRTVRPGLGRGLRAGCSRLPGQRRHPFHERLRAPVLDGLHSGADRDHQDR